jgi:hypothetical protein
MSPKKTLIFLLSFAVTVLAWAAMAGAAPYPAAASGDPAPATCDLYGQTLSAARQPIAQARVTIHNMTENTDRTVVSGSDGAFAVASLMPGRYQVSASKSGFTRASVKTVQVEPQRRMRVDMILAASAQPRAATDIGRARNGAAPAPDAGSLAADREKELLDRIDQLEHRLAALEARESGTTTQAGTQTANRAQPVQVASLNTAGALPLPALTALATASAVTASTSGGPVAPVAPAASTPPANATVAGAPAAGAPSGALSAATQPAAQTTPQQPAKPAPFSDADWTWLNGNPRTKDIFWDSKFFTPEIRSDVTGTWDNQHPTDHSMGGSSELFRSGELQLEQLGIGGDFHWDNVRARFMTQFGEYSVATIRNDGSYTHGEWNLADADRYLSEAYGGYHFNWMYGVNVDAGIFMSYIGLFSYYNFDNWAYQPSYVSSNTPWFFEGIRIQIFPSEHLKIEPWIINGWQSYGSANNRPGLGGQLKWTPFPWMNVISNNYGLGHDDLYTPNRARIHTDNSLEIKYYDKPQYRGLDKMAFTFTGDIGCEYGGGVSCTGDHAGGPKQSFIGAMVYNRWWFDKDQFAVTLGGGAINNPGRYLVLLPPINGETAGSAAVNSPYFTENPGDPFKAWDSSFTFDWMPKQYITFRIEPDYRHANVPYWSGHGGITPPAFAGTASNVVNGNGYPTEYACNSGASSGATALSAAEAACGGGLGSVWFPSLVKNEFLVDFDIMVKF